MISMEIVQENPLQIKIDVPINRFSTNNKNSAGRPSKKNEIKFSPPPKSIISILLSKRKSNDIDCNTSSKKIIKIADSETNDSTQDFIEGNLATTVCNKQNVELQKEKLYKCKHSNCTYATKFHSNLKTHKRTHTTEQPFICDKCTFRSKFISSLKTHKRLHKDEKPFACKYCVYKCNSSSNLKKHKARKHKEHEKDK